MKWVRRIGIVLLVFVAGAAAILLGMSEWTIRRDRGAPLPPIVADRSPAGIAEGERLARISGCLGCHGPNGNGVALVDEPVFAVLTAPPLAEVAMRASDAELARTIRSAVARDGGALWIMPPHAQLADDDTARIIGFLRTLKPSPRDLARRRSFGPLSRLAMVGGGFRPTSQSEIAAATRRPADVGRYFATGTCLGCHDLHEPRHAGRDEVAPPLGMMVAAYDDAAFRTLLRTGIGASGKSLGLMTEVSRSGLRHFTDQEIAAIRAYLIKAGAGGPPAQGDRTADRGAPVAPPASLTGSGRPSPAG
jgi:mono/diheme cytochrome c family protein